MLARQKFFLLAVTLFVLGNVAAHWSPRTGFTSLIRFGEDLENRRLPVLAGLPLATVPGAGYDGQFYAQLAVEPNIASPDIHRALDEPAYRARRILLPLLAHALGFGSAWWTLQIYALLNTAAWLLLAWCWWRWLPDHGGLGQAIWFASVLSLGALDSVRFSLTDLPMVLGLVAATRAIEGGRPRLAALAFLASGFVRETAVLAIRPLSRTRDGRSAGAPPNLSAASKRQSWIAPWRTWSWPALLCAVPVALWSLALLRVAPGSAVGFAGNFDWPGFAWARHSAACVRELVAGNWDSRDLFGLIGAACMAYQSIYLLRRWRDPDPWLRLGLPFAVLFWFLGDFVWHGYWAVARTTLPMTFAFNRALLTDRRAIAHLVAGNLFVLHSVYRFCGV